MNITQLVKKVGVSRSAYYNHIADPQLPIDTLLKYGKVLHYDFMEDFPELFTNNLADGRDSYTQLSHAETKEEAEKQRDIWKEKYYELLEKYMALKEQQDGKG